MRPDIFLYVLWVSVTSPPGRAGRARRGWVENRRELKRFPPTAKPRVDKIVSEDRAEAVTDAERESHFVAALQLTKLQEHLLRRGAAARERECFIPDSRGGPFEVEPEAAHECRERWSSNSMGSLLGWWGRVESTSHALGPKPTAAAHIEKSADSAWMPFVSRSLPNNVISSVSRMLVPELILDNQLPRIACWRAEEWKDAVLDRQVSPS